MPQGNKVSGLLYFRVDGVQHMAKGNFEYSLGGVKRTAVKGDDGVHGYDEEPIEAYIEGDITHGPALDEEALNALDDVTVTLELVTKKTVLLPNAWNASEHKTNASGGMSKVRFEAKRGEIS